VNESALGIRANVQLHAKVPLVTFPGLMHLGITGVRRVLRRAGRVEDRCVNHCAARQLEPSLGQQTIDPIKDRSPEIVGFKQAAEFEQRRCIGDALLSKINLRELAQQRRVVECLFASLVSEIEPELQEVNSQHPLQPDRTAAIARLRVVRLNQLAQRTPRHQCVHLNQKFGLPGRTTMRREVRRFQSHTGKASLFHRCHFNELLSLNYSTEIYGTCSVFP